MFSVPRDQASGERRSTSMGPTVAATRPSTCCARATWRIGAAEVLRVTEVDGRDGSDGLGHNLFRIDDDAQRQAHEDGELGARVEAADVFSGIGFGIAFGLRLGQHGRILGAFIHFAEDEVAGAVENAFHALDAIAGETLLEAGDHRNAAGNSSAILQVSALGRGQPLEIDAVIGNELLVGGDNALAGFKSAAHPAAGWIEAAGQFHDDVDIGGEHSVGVFAPDNALPAPRTRACGPRRG